MGIGVFSTLHLSKTKPPPVQIPASGIDRERGGKEGKDFRLGDGGLLHKLT